MLKAAKFLKHFDNVMLKFLTDDEKAALKGFKHVMPRIVAKLPVSEGLSQPQHASEIYTPIEQPQKKSRLLQY